VVGDLDVGQSVTVTINLTVPSTVTRFSITETGTLQNVGGANYSFSIGQAVIP
jgi:von Willebrand factor A domain-containing protein 7